MFVKLCNTFHHVSFQNGEPGVYNDFLRKFKDTLTGKGRKDFWEQAVEGKNKITQMINIMM